MKVRLRDDCNMLLTFKVANLLPLGIEKLGPQRFMNYWESHHDVFEDYKFLLHMTLREVLLDDLVDLETCALWLLPWLGRYSTYYCI